MSDQENRDQLDQVASDQLDAGHQDQLETPAGDQLDQVASDQLDDATTGDLETAPTFPDAAPAVDTDDDAEQASLPHPYSNGFGVAGKFDAEAAPDAGDVVQDDEAPADQDETA